MLLPLIKQHKKWFQMAIYSVMVLSGQSAATLLGRLYYEKGGKSKYMIALVQSAGFPILIPFLHTIKTEQTTITTPSKNNSAFLPILYIFFGTFLALDCMLYSLGLMYLPLSTFSLICATQLGFNAFFSYFVNSQKLTPLIVNTIFILTLSTILLVFQHNSDDDDDPTTNHRKYALGFACTLSGAALYALLLSLQQLAYGRVLLERKTVRDVLNVIFYESMVTSFALLVGLFAGGEWRGLKGEMDGFGLGRKMYAVVLVCAAVSWQVFGVGMVSLVLKISSLFANVVSTMNVAVVPVLGVLVFQDKMSGLKIVALLLAVWGCVSYVYQQYLDDDDDDDVVNSRAENEASNS